jgi:predicted O-methyltransferase YrrM
MRSEKYERAALQDKIEIYELCRLIKESAAHSYLEIGSKHGGSLWRVANSMPTGSRIVSIDSPGADGSFKESMPNLELCISHLRQIGYKAHLIIGDSTDSETIQKAKAFAPFDVLMIDANHTKEFVESDWRNYGPMAKIIAFHDIRNPRAQVREVFESVCQSRKTRIIFNDHRPNDELMGIGVVWMT